MNTRFVGGPIMFVPFDGSIVEETETTNDTEMEMLPGEFCSSYLQLVMHVGFCMANVVAFSP